MTPESWLPAAARDAATVSRFPVEKPREEEGSAALSDSVWLVGNDYETVNELILVRGCSASGLIDNPNDYRLLARGDW